MIIVTLAHLKLVSHHQSSQPLWIKCGFATAVLLLSSYAVAIDDASTRQMTLPVSHYPIKPTYSDASKRDNLNFVMIRTAGSVDTTDPKPIKSEDTQSTLSDASSEVALAPTSVEVISADTIEPIDWVSDYTDTLTEKEKSALNEQLAQVSKKNLLQIGVLLIPSTGNISIFDYALTVANNWEIGSDKNNGVLIIAAIDDKKVYILTGLGVTDDLPDERVARIIQQYITPTFAKQEYAKGLEMTIKALMREIQNIIIV